MTAEETQHAPEYKTSTKLILGVIVALFVLAGVAMMSGCYNPDLSKVKYKCDIAGLCPDATACVGGWCGGPPTGSETDAGMMASADMATNAPAPDMSIPLYKRTVAPPCKSMDGYRLENDVWVCVGTFTGDPSSQCNQGYAPCTGNIAPMGCDWLASQRLGCFVSGVRLAPFKEPINVATTGCGWTGKDATVSRGLAACGICPTTAAAPACAANFPHGVNCYEQTTPPSQTQTDFRCARFNGTDSDFIGVANQNPNWGILCCPS
jgi:hypothetical protein